MNREHLQSYLNDHLAGATSGLELIGFLISSHRDEEGSTDAFEALRVEVAADEKTLRDLIDRLGFEAGTVRQATAWAMEKLARIKFLVAGADQGSLGKLQAMDTLAAGIEGKAALWAALGVISGVPPIQALDLEHLQRRAGEQRADLEALRLRAARAAFEPEG